MLSTNDHRQLNLLASPGFLIGVSLLLLNDFVFKPTLHNALSGKLSDFSGLFVFPLFCVALRPRLRSPIYLVIAVLFAFWKSAYAQPMIDGWNSLSVFNVDRSVDYSDLLALFILPVSFRYSLKTSPILKKRVALLVIGIVSVFAFAATSYSAKTAYDNEYSFPFSKQELLERMRRLATNDVYDPFWEADDFEISFDSCIHNATIFMNVKDNQTVMTLKEINYRCPRPPGKEVMQEYFEKEFINKLKEPSVVKSPRVEYIWGVAKETPESTPNPRANKPRSRP
jgi:hypothetical protein